MAQIFFSYSHVDQPFVDDLTVNLQFAFPDVKFWVDNRPGGIVGGDNWWQAILAAIADSDIFIYVLSNESIQSQFCSAEFTEARRLQKPIITIQARDNTKLTEELADIQYIDMKNGPRDVGPLQRLNNAIHNQLSGSRRKRPKWTPATPKPKKLTEPSREIGTPPIATAPLGPPDAEINSRRKLRWQIGLGIAAVIATLLAGIITVVPWYIDRIEAEATNNASNTALAQTLLAQASSNTPDPLTVTITLASSTSMNTQTDTPVDSATPSITATGGLSETPDVVAAAMTIVAQLTTQSVVDSASATSARATLNMSLNETQNAAFTATATQWTPTIALSASARPTPASTLTPVPLQELLRDLQTDNLVWKTHPVEREIDGFSMVLVPPGCFEMGNDPEGMRWNGSAWIVGVESGDIQCFDEPFWLDKYEIINRYFTELGCRETSMGPYQPRNCVSWVGAQSVCDFLGGRLPTEAEWEYAARGPSNWVYPWGNDFRPEYVVFSENTAGLLAEIDTSDLLTEKVTYTVGSSWVGAEDMSGNVWEWVLSEYKEYPYNPDDGRENTDQLTPRSLRGGSFRSNSEFVRTTTRHGLSSDFKADDVGFRCMREFEWSHLDE